MGGGGSLFLVLSLGGDEGESSAPFLLAHCDKTTIRQIHKLLDIVSRRMGPLLRKKILNKLMQLYLIFLIGNCTKKTSPAEGSPPSPVDVRAVESKDGLLDVGVDIQDAAVVVQISNGPQDAQYKCILDDNEIAPCHPGASWRKPPPGDHTLVVKAFVDSKVVAGGQINFSLLPDGVVGSTSGVAKALDVVITHESLQPGGTWPTTQDLKLNIALLQKSDCDAPKFECAYGDIWRACGAAESETISRAWMANGLQILKVRARCNEQIGREATLQWYGVDDDYENLKLMKIQVLKNPASYVVRLWRGEDCPSATLTYQESAPGADTFRDRPGDPTVVEQPPSGFRVRAKCNNVSGPIVTF